MSRQNLRSQQAASGAVEGGFTNESSHANESRLLMVHRFFDALGLLIGVTLVAAGIWSSAQTLADPINFYDEGILLSGANSILQGSLPHRDFYANYPPGVFLIIAGLWKVSGTSVISVRLLGLLLHLCAGAFAGLIGASCVGKRFSWIAAGSVVFWLSDLALTPWPWITGVVTALLFIWLLLRAKTTKRIVPWAAAGLAWGALLCIRHDLFVYLTAGFFALAVGWRVFDRDHFGQAINSRRLAVFVIAGLVPMVAIWLPILARSGVGLVMRDLYFDQVKYVLPARVLPIPPLLRVSTDLWELPLPAFLVERHQGAVVLCLAAPLVLAAMLAWRKALGVKVHVVALLLVLSLAVMLQLLGRSDQAHAVGCVTPALISIVALVEGLASRSNASVGRIGSLIGGVLLLTLPLMKDFRLAPKELRGLQWGARDGGLPYAGQVAPGRDEALRFIAKNSSRNEGIFVGTFLHRWAFINAADLYYLADRRGATRYMQFDPGLVNRRDVQEEMVQQMEDQRTRVVVLTACCPISGEPNASMVEGSDVLDRYLATRFRPVNQVGTYLLLLRAGE